MDGNAALRLLLLLLLTCAGLGGCEEKNPAGNRSVPGTELRERRFQTLSRSECQDGAVPSSPGLKTPGANAVINYLEAGGELGV